MSFVALAPSPSGGVAIRYVLPVLWMMSHLAVVGLTACFNTGAQFDVYECRVTIVKILKLHNGAAMIEMCWLHLSAV